MEAMKPFCTTFLLIAVFAFIKNKSPMSTAATVESIFGAAYFGVGRGIGGFIGGFAIDGLGITATFQLVAAIAAACTVAYAVVTFLRNRFCSGKMIVAQV